jgi:hypothetical protein
MKNTGQRDAAAPFRQKTGYYFAHTRQESAKPVAKTAYCPPAARSPKESGRPGHFFGYTTLADRKQK